MPDIGERATEREFEALRDKFDQIYRQAYSEVTQKALDFANRYAARDAKYSAAVAAGKMSKADYRAWKMGQVFQGRQWQARRYQMCDTMLNADNSARDIINNSRFKVFAANANAIGYSIERDRNASIGFTLYSAESVARLLRDDPDLLPPRKEPGKDASYAWYNRQIQNAVVQGIIQGESIPKIALRIGKQTGEANMNAMLRNARTMMTGAQNAGRLEAMKQSRELGVDVQKEWIATLDRRTRSAHADLDGDVQDIDKPFVNSLGEIMYPGDPDADPDNVWNCRCTLGYSYPDSESFAQRRDNETDEVIEDMDYHEWAAMKGYEEEGPEEEAPELELADSNDGPEYSVADLVMPTRPRKRDFADEDEYRQALDLYKQQREEYDGRIGESIEAALNYTRFQSRQEVEEWMKQNGISVADGVFERIDLRAFNEMSLALDEMFKRFPEIKSFTLEYFDGSTFDSRFSIGLTDDGLLSANGGFNFNPSYFADYSNGLDTALTIITDGQLVRGDGTFSTLVRHEFGHNVQSYIETRIDMKYHANVDDWRKNFGTFEEYSKAKEMHRQEKSQFESELLSLVGLKGSSDYSNTNTLELFAEGFAEYTSGGRSEFGIRFGEFLNRWY